ncbi:hypothetical protein S7711_11483 [Stachybotrys chartarum IBT 7711]|uniref:Uncharacterized protein n=1 Tax=Stachybotrys chartarum (strain CBS 109288 / IBT 7711) TaxID=1280523 RepID=A0A084AZT0_STACB|nr:hypothetical protein S7711_11483 [Stachybotrys chartarum IBT 7711]
MSSNSGFNTINPASLRRTPTESSYAGAPTQASRPYPSYYGNRNNNPVTLSTPAEPIPHPAGGTTQGWLHNPLIPNQQHTFRGAASQAGAVRSVYPPSDPSKFDVIYHAAGDPAGQFRNATYYPKAK